MRPIVPFVSAVVLLAGCGTGGLVKRGDKDAGKKLFVQKCAACHTLSAAGTSGTIGPNLDDAFAEARQEGYKESAIEDIVAGQIRAPGQYGTGSGEGRLQANMPANLVRGQQLADVAAFVAANAGLQGFAGPATATGVTGLAIFNQQGCAACHTLAAAGAHGTIGPDLDKLQAEAQGAGKPLAAFVRESIVNPNAYIAPGYPSGVMPQNFGHVLSKSQLASLVQFLVASAKKGGK